MNKYIKYIPLSTMRWPYLLLLFLGIITSCKKDQEMASVTQVPALTVSTNAVVLNRDQATQKAISLSWSAASVSGMNGSVTYFLQWDRKGNNFANPVNVTIGKDSLKASFTHSAFNNLMGTLPAGVATPIDMRVVGATSDGSVAPFYSNTLSITVTAYAKAIPPPYSQLWLLGDATPNGWTLDGATPLVQDSADPFMFSYTGTFSAGDFKIATAKSFDAPFYRPLANHQPLNNTKAQLNAGDPDNKWQITKAGKYRVTLNLHTLRLIVSDLRSNDPPPYSKLWIVGDATPKGWDIDNATPMVQDSADPYVFTYTGTLTAGEFKIPTQKNWNDKFYRPVADHQDLADTDVKLSAGDPDNKWQITAAGNYKVILDLRSVTITIVKF
jgi:hypothetical protein